MNRQEWIQLALECGATKATIIDCDQMVLSAQFREICAQNACGLYGRCWMCPPDVGDIDTLMKEIRSFDKVLWYQTIGEIEDSFDVEGMDEVANRHAQVCKNILISVHEKYAGTTLELTNGGCRLCEKCAKKTGELCRQPQYARPSLESYGVDVYNTTKDTDLKYINGQNTVTYFGAVLFLEKENA